jgi:hypothetical protein
MEEVGQPHASAALRQVIYSPKSLLNRKLGGFQEQYKLLERSKITLPAKKLKRKSSSP